MRLTLLALIGVLCLACAYALDNQDDNQNNDQVIGLLDVADQGAAHANEGDREARQWGGGYGGRGWGGHGGYGGGGWGGRRGYGGGGWGRGGYGWGGRGYGGGGWGR
ncbi:glycine-rich RNA-binding, abscisic acid-inducible protein [Drosophila obscura]|uniref:glycine-rich RNA-binding, abscisic acid-inducible protein n=1 Tax=Drosophila obscura TaxID=7282 RepID=UPI000BA12326|nr:glycine-rich RNA-binding, abscisic acid-inducible protein [Drosophila obscura]